MYKEEEVFNPYQYTGRRYDEETGQYYYRARMYSPVQSRFISSDPMGMVDGPNMYTYARNDPANARDPSGCMSVPPRYINGGGGGIGVSSEEWSLGDTAQQETGDTAQQGTGTSGGGMGDPSEHYSIKIYSTWWGFQYAARVTLTEEATDDFAFSMGWATFLSSAIVGALIAKSILTGGISLYVTGTMIGTATAVAATCSYNNQRLALYWYIGGGVMPAMWCR